ncbi:MAG TPA: SDR family oxidoreductase [Trinickia sp.]|jgi:NAD(P)-dependent dehydrogenase (short-subunit alcohol dehydrogenase family)|nr:SDR family oxidoreductase [Trinickia sp.]
MTASSPDLRADADARPARVVLVTGGARRIGRALALGFAAQGWDVGVHYRSSRTEAEQVVAEIEALGRRAVALGADLSVERDVAQLVPACTEALGRPVCVVNNASLFAEDTAHDVGYDMLAVMMAVNVGAPLVLARELHDATPDAARDDETLRGVVINLLDQKLYNLNPDYLSYTLSKAALQTATVMLAQALAPKLRVVGIAPGLTLPSAYHTLEAFVDAHRVAPLGRSSRPEDIVAAACYLADARGVTGTTLIVDGGQHLVPLPRDVMFLTR